MRAPRQILPHVGLLGTATRIHPHNSNVLMNLPLIEALARQKGAVVQPLGRLLYSSMHRLQIIEGLYLAQRLAELKAPGVKSLYAATTRFQYSTDPLVQVYLAGFYRKLNVPESFGPMLEMLVRQAQQPPRYQPGLNPMEEVGGTILQQLAEHSAAEVLKRLASR